jgi:hypothetical protein
MKGIVVACPNQFLMGTQQVAWLNFATVSNQSSDFVGLSLSDLRAYQSDGTPVANFAPQSGRVVIAGEQPLVEMVFSTNKQTRLILYGKPASGCVIQWRTNLAEGNWRAVLTNLTVTTSLFLDFTPPPGNGRVNFYRAVRIDLPMEKILSLAQMSGSNVVLSLSGFVGRPYQVQVNPSLSPTNWQTIGTAIPGPEGRTQFTDTNGWWQTQRYYRFIWP